MVFGLIFEEVTSEMVLVFDRDVRPGDVDGFTFVCAEFHTPLSLIFL